MFDFSFLMFCVILVVRGRVGGYRDFGFEDGGSFGGEVIVKRSRY